MATPADDAFKNPKEHPSTYMVQNRSSSDELTRVDDQDRLFTRCM